MVVFQLPVPPGTVDFLLRNPEVERNKHDSGMQGKKGKIILEEVLFEVDRPSPHAESNG